MCILLICLAFALLTYQMGMSLAIGAFLAGLMVSETEYSHNAFGHIIPFKDTFTSFFFVSIGMMLDLQFIADNASIVALTVFLVIAIKIFIAGGTGFIMGHTLRGTILVGIALGQVGEFSFILAKVGLDYFVITPYLYQLFLATAVITMSLSPFLFKIARPLSEWALKLPLPKYMKDGLFPLPEIEIPELKNHIVFIGKDTRSQYMAIMAKHHNIKSISVIFDPSIAQERQKKGDLVIYGDAVNEPILKKAHINTAEIVVISVGDLITAMAITEKIRNLSKHIYIIVRTKHIDEIENLYKLGANQVIPEEFETAIELFERVLTKLLVPENEINKALSRIRDDNYGIFREKTKKKKSFIFKELPNIEISAISINENSPAVKHSIEEMDFRGNFGVIAVAIKRGENLIEHPERHTVLFKNDIIYLLGKPENIANIVNYLTSFSK
jgi:CPA2 family monovalent cation:H+ antiporter-2